MNAKDILSGKDLNCFVEGDINKGVFMFRDPFEELIIDFLDGKINGRYIRKFKMGDIYMSATDLLIKDNVVQRSLNDKMYMSYDVEQGHVDKIYQSIKKYNKIEDLSKIMEGDRFNSAMGIFTSLKE